MRPVAPVIVLLVEASGDPLVGGDGLRGSDEVAGDPGGPLFVKAAPGREPRHWTHRALFGQLRYVHFGQGHLPNGPGDERDREPSELKGIGVSGDEF